MHIYTLICASVSLAPAAAPSKIVSHIRFFTTHFTCSTGTKVRILTHLRFCQSGACCCAL